MKKTYTSFCFIIFCSSFLYAQNPIPNAGFESWITVDTYMDPVGWETDNADEDSPNCSRVSPGQSGSYAVKLESVVTTGTAGFASLFTDFASSQKPAAFNGYIKSNFKTGDNVTISCVLKNSQTPIALASNSITTNYSSFTPFSLPFYYYNAITPDAVEILVLFSPGSFAASGAGGFVVIDNLSFGALSGALDDGQNKRALAPVIFPNVVTEKAIVSYTLLYPSRVKAEIVDITGRVVMALPDELKPQGVQQFNLSVKNLANGIYFCRLKSDTDVSSIKFIVQH